MKMPFRSRAKEHQTVKLRAPTDLNASPIPEFSWVEIDAKSSLEKLFRWLEQRAIVSLNWYVVEKKRKARQSKLLRAVSIISISIGGVIPIVSLITNKRLDPEWSLIALAIGGSLILSDRAFGFSASWARYLATMMLLTSRIQVFQLRWTRWLATEGAATPTVKEILEGIDILSEFSATVAEIVEGETEQWTEEFRAAIDELRTRASTAPSP